MRPCTRDKGFEMRNGLGPNRTSGLTKPVWMCLRWPWSLRFRWRKDRNIIRSIASRRTLRSSSNIWGNCGSIPVTKKSVYSWTIYHHTRMTMQKKRCGRWDFAGYGRFRTVPSIIPSSWCSRRSKTNSKGCGRRSSLAFGRRTMRLWWTSQLRLWENKTYKIALSMFKNYQNDLRINIRLKLHFFFLRSSPLEIDELGYGAIINISVIDYCEVYWSGFFFDSLNWPKVLISGTYFLLFIPLAYFDPVFNKCIVFPFFSV